MIDIRINAEQVAEEIEGKAEAIVAAVRGEMPAVVGNLLAYIQDEKLSGQVLNQRSGNLKRSGFTEVTEVGADTVGYVGFGRAVPYAAIQNYGGTIPEVSGKLMVFQRGGDTIFTMRHRAFDLPARNYLESSATEQEPAIQEQFREAIEGAVNA